MSFLELAYALPATRGARLLPSSTSKPCQGTLGLLRKTTVQYVEYAQPLLVSFSRSMQSIQISHHGKDRETGYGWIHGPLLLNAGIISRRSIVQPI